MNNQTNERPTIELLPQLNRRCRIVVMLLRVAFALVPVAIGLWAWSKLGWLYGLMAWLTALFAGIIVLSKLKLAYIPFDQHELSHSTTAILTWFVARRLCR